MDLITILYNQAAQPSTYSFAVMLGKGDGTFEPSVAYPVNANLGGPALGDFSANGKLDLAFPNTTNTIIVPGNGDGTFDLTNLVTLSVNTFSLASGDFNNDGKLDLAVSYQPPGPGGPPSVPGFVTYLLQDSPLAGLSPSSLPFVAQPLGTTSSPQNVVLNEHRHWPAESVECQMRTARHTASVKMRGRFFL